MMIRCAIAQSKIINQKSKMKRESMNSLVRDKGYKKLLADIAILYSNARSVLVQTYWEIGKRIVEQEQSGSDKPEYGSHLVEQLSCLSGKPV